MADTTGGTANPGGNLPRPTPEQIFRTILGCTTLSEEFIDQVLIASRFRNIRVATNLSQDQLDALEVKAQALRDDFTFEFLEFAFFWAVALRVGLPQPRGACQPAAF